MLLFIACASDPTAHLGPSDVRNALGASDGAPPRRWLDRYAVVGPPTLAEDGRPVAAAYGQLSEPEALEALTGLLHGRYAQDAARELVSRHGPEGCRRVYEAWNEGDDTLGLGPTLEVGLTGQLCVDAAVVAANPRARALRAEVAEVRKRIDDAMVEYRREHP